LYASFLYFLKRIVFVKRHVWFFRIYITKKIHVNSLRVYVSADNLLTFTKYSGYDPETSFSGSPGDSNYGVDFGLQPVLRTFIFGLNLNF
ncbi:hypothetical protein, partial [Bacteroides thetaiotaomicron]|uniref:hypothetical protein n=1 Tax=Bacteroides thetaiotaomicron TaxID=818 RepID=UPI001CE2CFD5